MDSVFTWLSSTCQRDTPDTTSLTLSGTSTKGHKGAQSRTGYSRSVGFEGGQMPLQRRIPKFGFKNINRIEYQGINLDKIQSLIDNKKIKRSIDLQSFIDNGLAKKNDLIKILANGTINAPLKITAHKFSAAAKSAIEKSGGEAIVL